MKHCFQNQFNTQSFHASCEKLQSKMCVLSARVCMDIATPSIMRTSLVIITSAAAILDPQGQLVNLVRTVDTFTGLNISRLTRTFMYRRGVTMLV
jgi:hypothetical protein